MKPTDDIPYNREVFCVLFHLKTCKTAKTAEHRKLTSVSLAVARSEMLPERTPTARVTSGKIKISYFTNDQGYSILICGI